MAFRRSGVDFPWLHQPTTRIIDISVARSRHGPSARPNAAARSATHLRAVGRATQQEVCAARFVGQFLKGAPCQPGRADAVVRVWDGSVPRTLISAARLISTQKVVSVPSVATEHQPGIQQ